MPNPVLPDFVPMKTRTRFVAAFLLISLFSAGSAKILAQALDLIVKTNGDSLVCRIDSVDTQRIYFEAKFNGKWARTYVERRMVASYEKAVIDKKETAFYPGTSMIKPLPEDGRPEHRNAVYGTIGFLGLWAVGEINYEHLLKARDGRFFNSLWLRTGIGGFAGWEISGPIGVAGVSLLTGKRNNHIEINGGFTALFDKTGYDIGVSNARGGYDDMPSRSDYIDWAPSGGIGYRFQKPGGATLFRAGLSFPESAYLSFGWQF